MGRVVLCSPLIDTTTVAPGPLIDGKYELVEVAGEGGMATVFRAVVRGAAGFQRTVAIKRIRPEYRAVRHYIDMFIEEARVGAELAHPNIVQVHDFCSSEGAYYLIMEWVDGLDLGTLQGALARATKHLSWPLVVAVAIGTLRGLAAAHDRRTANGEAAPVIHRDVSPQNILLAASGAVKLTDFGLSRARDRANSLTVPGTVKGKLSYLAPEVTLGRPNSVASDLFSMGVVMWEVLCGQRLFDGRNDLEIFKKIRACAVPSVRLARPDVPEELAAVVARATALAPKHRYEHASEMIAELSRIEGGAVDSPELIGRAVAEARTLIAAARQRALGARSVVSASAPEPQTLSEAAAEPSVTLEISTADLTVEPLPLDRPKR